MGRLIIEVITAFYNDEFLAPFFLNHYSWADRIHALVDEATTDSTEEVLSRYPNVHVEHFRFPDLYEDELFTAQWNRMYAESEANWVVAASSDEFVFPPQEGMHEYLARQLHDVIFVRLFQVYRHAEEPDLDPSVPVRLQRRHGDPGHVKGQNREGRKPIVVRTGLRRLKWMPGVHKIWNRHRYDTSPDVLIGAHWHMADPAFCVQRRLSRCARTSPKDIAKGHGCHNVGVIADEVLEECRSHSHDPRVF